MPDYVSSGKPPPGARNPETRLIGEYVATKFAGRRTATLVALGPAVDGLAETLPQTARLRHSRPWRPEVDAVVWMDGVLLLIEAKVADYVSGIAKLPLYKSLIPSTPELSPWWGWEIRMRLVVPRARAWHEAMAANAGVEIDIFEPPWMRDYWEYRDRYWTAEYRQRRQAVLETRRQLGVE